MAVNLDFAALRQGGAIALVVGAPCAIGSSILASDDDNSPLVALLWLGAVAGFIIGAGVAAWVQRRGTPLIHGLVCAGGTYIAVLSNGQELNVSRIQSRTLRDTLLKL